MRRARLLLGSLPLFPVIALAASCGEGASRIGLVMESPQGLLDSAGAVKLSVFPSNQAKCLATGHVTKIPAGDTTQTYSLSQSGCEKGVAWCKDIELDKDDSEKMFAVVATDSNGAILAEGCDKAKINQDPLEVAIKVIRYNAPPCCNDGKVQATEQCEGGQAATDCATGSAGGACKGIIPTPVCDCLCRAAEIPLDHQGDVPPPPSTKAGISLAFCSGSGQIENGLRAAYTDNSVPANTNVMVRTLKQDLYPVDVPLALAGPLPIPVGCDGTEPGTTAHQKDASIASVTKSSTAVVYLSDQAGPGGLWQVYLSHQSDDGCKAEDPRKVNATEKISNTPDVAGGPGGKALIVWTTNASEALARIWDSTMTGMLDPFTPTGADLPLVTNASSVKVAGSPVGWAVVYAGTGDGDANGIFLIRVDETGKAEPAVKVNGTTDGQQDQPDVAMLPDGRVMVVWHSAGDIYFQRFDKSGKAIEGDQTAPIHIATGGEQANPAVAAAIEVGDFYVAAWENSEIGTVSARYVGADAGFLYNSVTGQNDDFLATHPDFPGPAHVPAVAIGGGGFVAIGWQDDDPNHSGIYARRFPLPLAAE